MQPYKRQVSSDAAMMADGEEEDDDDLLPPAKKAKLIEDTVVTAMRNRHPLDLCWGGSAWPENSRSSGVRTVSPAPANR